MWILYQTVMALTLAVAGPLMLLRRGRHYWPTLRGRLGSYGAAATAAPLWVHAVSVGETRVAAVLAGELPERWPLMVTTVTPTGQAQAHALCGRRATIAYLPFDLGFAVRRFFDRFRPRALVLIEGDYWPLVLRYARRRAVPVVVVNGRVGDRSFQRLRRLPRIARLLLSPIEKFAMQTTDDRDRLLALGVEPSRIAVTGNLKFDAPVPPPLPAAEAVLLTAANGRPILIAGSTMPGEEEKVLAAFAAAGGGDAGLLVLAPRHPERWSEVAKTVTDAGLSVRRRSEQETAATAASAPDVMLLDTLGELAALYRIAAGSFVGGTLVPTGGHNPLEPAIHGIAVAAGPAMDNFRHMAAAFDAADAWRRVADVDALGEFFRQAIAGNEQLRACATRGRELVAANRGAVERTLNAVKPVLDEAMS